MRRTMKFSLKLVQQAEPNLWGYMSDLNCSKGSSPKTHRELAVVKEVRSRTCVSLQSDRFLNLSKFLWFQHGKNRSLCSHQGYMQLSLHMQCMSTPRLLDLMESKCPLVTKTGSLLWRPSTTKTFGGRKLFLQWSKQRKLQLALSFQQQKHGGLALPGCLRSLMNWTSFSVQHKGLWIQLNLVNSAITWWIRSVQVHGKTRLGCEKFEHEPFVGWQPFCTTVRALSTCTECDRCLQKILAWTIHYQGKSNVSFMSINSRSCTRNLVRVFTHWAGSPCSLLCFIRPSILRQMDRFPLQVISRAEGVFHTNVTLQTNVFVVSCFHLRILEKSTHVCPSGTDIVCRKHGGSSVRAKVWFEK